MSALLAVLCLVAAAGCLWLAHEVRNAPTSPAPAPPLVQIIVCDRTGRETARVWTHDPLFALLLALEAEGHRMRQRERSGRDA